MAARYFGFYEDSVKTVKIIESTTFLSKPKRKDFYRGGNYRLEADNTLETWRIGTDKYEERLRLAKVLKADKDLLQTEYDLHRTFYYFPDLKNDASIYYAVKWVGAFDATPMNKANLFNMTISLKEV